MIRLLSIVVFAVHYLLLRADSRWKWIIRAGIGLPSVLMVALYFIIGSEENRDILYIIPIFAIAPIVLAEIVALAVSGVKNIREKN